MTTDDPTYMSVILYLFLKPLIITIVIEIS